MIRLYGHKASRAQRCVWMLEELALGFEHVPTHFKDASKESTYLAINPNGKVPALVDGDLVLFESMAINLYLARRYGRGTAMALENLDEEARAMQWSFWVVSEVEGHLLTYLENALTRPEAERDAAVAAASRAKLERPLTVLEGALTRSPYLAGPEFGTADLNVAAVLAWAKMARFPFADQPTVKSWLDRCVKREAAIRARP